MEHERAANDRFWSVESKGGVDLVDASVTAFVCNRRLQISNKLLAWEILSIVTLNAVEMAIKRFASLTQVTGLMDVEAVLAGLDTPDVTPDVDFAVVNLFHVDSATEVVLLLWVLQHALSVGNLFGLLVRGSVRAGTISANVTSILVSKITVYTVSTVAMVAAVAVVATMTTANRTAVVATSAMAVTSTACTVAMTVLFSLHSEGHARNKSQSRSKLHFNISTLIKLLRNKWPY